MIQFIRGEPEDVRLEKLNKLAQEIEALGQQSGPAFSPPVDFAAVKRMYIDPATDELVLIGITGTERRYAAVP